MDKEELIIIDEDDEIEEIEESFDDFLVEEDRLKMELDKLNDRYLRLQAEYSNFRRRTEEEKSNIYRLGNERLIMELLPILDNFGRALETMEENNVSKSYKDGVEMIRKSLVQVLEKEGLECIEACGKEFDPEIHHAVVTEEAEGKDSGRVLEELQKGYKLKDKMIRPSMVKVSK